MCDQKYEGNRKRGIWLSVFLIFPNLDHVLTSSSKPSQLHSTYSFFVWSRSLLYILTHFSIWDDKSSYLFLLMILLLESRLFKEIMIIMMICKKKTCMFLTLQADLRRIFNCFIFTTAPSSHYCVITAIRAVQIVTWQSARWQAFDLRVTRSLTSANFNLILEPEERALHYTGRSFKIYILFVFSPFSSSFFPFPSLLCRAILPTSFGCKGPHLRGLLVTQSS